MENHERKAFYLKALEDQRHLLRKALLDMQAGDLTSALHIATIIRLLLHETGMSKPLLKRLCPDYLSLEIIDTGLDNTVPPRRRGERLLLYCPIAIQLRTEAPHLRLSSQLPPGVAFSIGKWWKDICYVSPETGEMIRSQVILGMANKEAAHADHEMEKAYERLISFSNLESMVNGVKIGFVNVSRLLVGKAGMQVLAALDKHFPKVAEV